MATQLPQRAGKSDDREGKSSERSPPLASSKPTAAPGRPCNECTVLLREIGKRDCAIAYERGYQAAMRRMRLAVHNIEWHNASPTPAYDSSASPTDLLGTRAADDADDSTTTEPPLRHEEEASNSRSKLTAPAGSPEHITRRASQLHVDSPVDDSGSCTPTSQESDEPRSASASPRTVTSRSRRTPV
jgi:hypothetical protein